MTPLCLTALLLAAPAFAQNGGGGSDTLYTFSGTDWGDDFGNSVANAGDVNADGIDDFVIGAPFTEPGALSNAGSVYVYSGADGSLLYQWDAANDYDQFGETVAAAGDVNADGYADIIIGAHTFIYQGGAGAGTAYVYSGFDGSLLHQWYGEANDNFFGKAVAGAGDTNGDGFDDLIVGAYRHDGLIGMAYVGRAYLFSGSNGALLHQWDGALSHDDFGYSVAGAGDVDQDGFDDVLIGAYGTDPGTINSAGSAFLYSGSTSMLIMRWDGNAEYDNLGYSVANAGDIDGDGIPDQMIESHTTSFGGATDTGDVFIYSGGSSTPLYHLTGESSGDYFGSGMAGAGDLNGDGFDDFLIGASGANTAYAYSGPTGQLLHRWHGATPSAAMGSSVAGAGDQDGDGLADVLVGAIGAEPTPFNRTGQAYVFNFHTFMSANISSVSATTGGVLNLDLDFPIAAAGHDYKVLISATGVGPTNYGVDIPLTQDSVVIDSFFGIYPVPNYSNMHGTLDASGNASASITVPAGIPAALVGRTYYLAAIASQAGQLPAYSSAAVSLEITL